MFSLKILVIFLVLNSTRNPLAVPRGLQYINDLLDAINERIGRTTHAETFNPITFDK